MTTITLTHEQVQSVLTKHIAPLTAQLAADVKKNDSRIAGVKRRADKRVENARNKTSEWRQRYGDMRKRLLEMQAENAELRRIIRDNR